MSEINQIEVAKFLISRLERLSVDSYWAHRASGIRGALLRRIEAINTNVEKNNLIQDNSLDTLINNGYNLLEKAAREIPESK